MVRLYLLFALLISVASAPIQATGVSPSDTCEDLLMNQWLADLVLRDLKQIAKFPGEHAEAASWVMFNLIQRFGHPAINFHFFERFFRLYRVGLYLVALPPADSSHYELRYPPEMAKLRGAETPRYQLWTGVPGYQEAARLKAHHNLSDEENLARLNETGVLFVSDVEAVREDPDVILLDEETVRALGRLDSYRPWPSPPTGSK